MSDFEQVDRTLFREFFLRRLNCGDAEVIHIYSQTADNSMLRSHSSLVFKVSQPSLMSAGRVAYTPTLIDVSFMALFRFREFYIAILLASLLLSVFFLHTNLWDSIAFCQKFV